MFVRQPRTTKLFEATLAKLAARGVVPSPHDSVWLHALCEDVVRGESTDVCTWVPPVVTIGDLSLYPLSVAARVWVDNYASQWWSDDYLMDILSMTWAMAHSLEPYVFRRASSPRIARFKITTWAMGQKATFEQMRDALGRHFGTDTHVEIASAAEPGLASPFDWGYVVCRIVAETGASPDSVLSMTEAQCLDVLMKSCQSKESMESRRRVRSLEALRLATERIATGAAAC